MIIALVLRPWTVIMIKEGCVPRLLADDMAVHAKGKDHAMKFHSAYNKTLEFLLDMGAKVAKKKCFLYSTSTNTRRWLELVQWEAFDNETIDVVVCARDIGAHLNTGIKANGATLTTRMEKATTSIGNVTPRRRATRGKEKPSRERTDGTPHQKRTPREETPRRQGTPHRERTPRREETLRR